MQCTEKASTVIISIIEANTEKLRSKKLNDMHAAKLIIGENYSFYILWDQLGNVLLKK